MDCRAMGQTVGREYWHLLLASLQDVHALWNLILSLLQPGNLDCIAMLREDQSSCMYSEQFKSK